MASIWTSHRLTCAMNQPYLNTKFHQIDLRVGKSPWKISNVPSDVVFAILSPAIGTDVHQPIGTIFARVVLHLIPIRRSADNQLHRTHVLLTIGLSAGIPSCITVKQKSGIDRDIATAKNFQVVLLFALQWLSYPSKCQTNYSFFLHSKNAHGESALTVTGRESYMKN